MMQPILLQKLAKSAGIGRQSGFLARCLITYPKSAMGHRFYKEPPPELEGLADYEYHLTHALNQSEHLTSECCHNLPTLSFSPAAKQVWTDFFNRVETASSCKVSGLRSKILPVNLQKMRQGLQPYNIFSKELKGIY